MCVCVCVCVCLLAPARHQYSFTEKDGGTDVKQKERVREGAGYIESKDVTEW